MKNLILNAWGTAHKISFHLADYAENNNLYVGMICHDDRYPEPWSDLTVNLSIECAYCCAFIDTNNNGKGIIDWLVENHLGYFTGRISASGFCAYPEFCFNLNELMKYVTLNERSAFE